MTERIAVVDQENRFVRWEERRVIHEKRLWHRSVHVMLFDSLGRLVIQRRHADKQTYARFWDCSASGHVEEQDYPGNSLNESVVLAYENAAKREVKEELGVLPSLKFIKYFTPDPSLHYEHLHLFLARSDGPFVFQKEEIEEIRSVSKEELTAMEQNKDPITGLLRFFSEFLQRENLWNSD